MFHGRISVIQFPRRSCKGLCSIRFKRFVLASFDEDAFDLPMSEFGRKQPKSAALVDRSCTEGALRQCHT
jgi:hypothetical protein